MGGGGGNSNIQTALVLLEDSLALIARSFTAEVFYCFGNKLIFFFIWQRMRKLRFDLELFFFFFFF